MKDAQKPDHISLNSLLARLKEGRFVIPNFQREFEWKPWDIRDLMRSIFLDYYIGSLLLWKGKDSNFEALSCKPVEGFVGDGDPEHIVLDGQQRLTALFYAFTAPEMPLPGRASTYYYFIQVDRFMAEEYDEAFGYDWTKRRREKLFADPENQFQEHIFPLSVVGAGGWELFTWIQGYEAYWKGQTEEASDEAAAQRARVHAENGPAFGSEIKGITEQYQISYIELDRDIGVDKVCDIFTQINSKGVRLDIFDLINALLVPKGLKLKHMWWDARERLDAVETEKMNVYILQVMSILRQAYCSPKYLYFLLPGEKRQVRDPDGTRRKEVLIPDTADFETRWKVAVVALESAIKVLRHPQEYGAVSSRYMPYVSILPAFAAARHEAKSLPAGRQIDAARKIRHWYWAAVFTNRYSGSVESTSARDFLDLRAWFADDDAEPALIGEFSGRFRDLDLKRETKKGTSIYNGVFNLLVLRGARDWMNHDIPQHDDLDDHHIVPVARGKDEDLKLGPLVHSILNRTPLTANTNRHVIRDRLPNEYLPELIAATGEKAVRGLMESHLISPAALDILLRDPFTKDDYEAFIEERRRTIFDTIESLLIKERLDLAPQLRELDERVEVAELGLRAAILDTLAACGQSAPDHLLASARERVAREAKRSVTYDDERYARLEGQLEFFDLRDLEATIANKALWPQFEPRFRSKGELATKFGQLAALRNGIRHSRAVDEVTRMEGEAALLWFEGRLS